MRITFCMRGQQKLGADRPDQREEYLRKRFASGTTSSSRCVSTYALIAQRAEIQLLK